MNKLKKTIMIDLNKEYKTRNGYDVKLMGIHDGYVVGIAIFKSLTPSATIWNLDDGTYESNEAWDLVEVEKTMTIWVNVYESGFGRYTYDTEEQANNGCIEGRIACIKIEHKIKN